MESAIVGFLNGIKGSALYAYVILYNGVPPSEFLKIEINQLVSDKIGTIAKCYKFQSVSGLPKTRNGKIIRCILRKTATNELGNLGDVSMLLNPGVVEEVVENRI